MKNEKRIEAIEQQAAQMAEKVKEMKRKAVQLRKEEEARENALAGEAMRRFWKQGFKAVEIDEIKSALIEVFGVVPASSKASEAKQAKARENINETSLFKT